MDTERIVTLRVELVDAKPKVWRELELPAELPLPLLHVVLQMAMGWEDAHLHGFARGREFWNARPIWTSYVEETGRELDEATGTLADILPRRSSVATYMYDYGDEWEHRLSIVDERPGSLRRITLVGGDGGVTPEDCGGVYGRAEVLRILEDTLAGRPVDPDEALFLEQVVGRKLAWARSQMLVLDFPEIKRALGRLPLSVPGLPVRQEEHEVVAADPGLLRLVRPDLMNLVAGSTAIPVALATMLSDARLDEAPGLDHETCVQLSEPVRWFLDLIGDGVPLTSAGYLRPAEVSAISERFEIGREWVGTLNRENQTPPVLELRKALTKLRLIRVSGNRLVPVAAVRKQAATPEGLVELIASRLPVLTSKSREFEAAAGLLVMLDLAGRPVSADDDTAAVDLQALNGVYSRLGRSLEDWFDDMSSMNSVRTGSLAFRSAILTRTVLERCGVMARRSDGFQWAPTKAGRAFLVHVLTLG